MRVLHIGKFFPPFAGGMENFMGDLLPALNRIDGVSCAALVHGHTEYTNTLDDYQGVPIYRVPCYGRLLYAPLSPAFPRWLERAIGEFRPDLLHIHMPNTSAFWCLRNRRAKSLPWLVHWHADVVASQLDRRLSFAYSAYRPFEQRLLARSDRIIVTSEPYLAASSALARWRERCRVIPLGLKPALSAPSADALKQAERLWQNYNLRLLCVGRLTYYKGHEVLLEALANCPQVRLLIAGSGERRSLLEKCIKALGLDARAGLLGYAEPSLLNALLASCDVFCLPSLERTEAFGVALLEAMRCGKPVIASDIPGSGTGWLLRSSQAGLTVPPGQPEALAEAIQTLAHNPGQRERLAQNGLTAFAQRFTIEHVAQQIGSLYAETASAKLKKPPAARYAGING